VITTTVITTTVITTTVTAIEQHMMSI